jgi:hypothetical protein
MDLDAGRATWRGIVELEADRVALRDATGAPHDIRDLFLPQDAIATVRETVADVGGGLVHTTLTWDDEDGRPPTDDQVPGLASLLRWAAEERPTTKNYYVTQQRFLRPLVEEAHWYVNRRVAVSRRVSVFNVGFDPTPQLFAR